MVILPVGNAFFVYQISKPLSENGVLVRTSLFAALTAMLFKAVCIDNLLAVFAKNPV